MPRANRYFLPDYLWHITRQCYKREFLLKFARHQRLWLQWVFESRKQFGVPILNYSILIAKTLGIRILWCNFIAKDKKEVACLRMRESPFRLFGYYSQF
jgi:hypothetical protein